MTENKEEMGVPASPSGHSAQSPKGLGHSASVLNAGLVPERTALLRTLVEANIARDGETSSSMVRSGLLLEIIDCALLVPDLYEVVAKLMDALLIYDGHVTEPSDREGWTDLDGHDAYMAAEALLAKVDPKVAVQEDLK